MCIKECLQFDPSFFLALGCHPVINLAAAFQRGLFVLRVGMLGVVTAEVLN